MTPEAYCQHRAVPPGSTLYYGLLYLGAEQRQAITALHAFCREVHTVVDECSEPQLARIKLQWWRQEIDNTFAGSAQHPVGHALTEPVRRFNLPLEHFLDIIDGVEMDLDVTRYPDFRELALYCHRVGGVPGIMAAEISGYRERETLDYGNALGNAFALTRIIRDVGEDARRGRVYLPGDEIQRFGVSTADILNGVDSQAMGQLMKFQADRARQYFQRALSRLPAADRYAQRGSLVMASILQATLDELERDGFRVLEHRVALTPLRKLWLAWRTVRREKRRARRTPARSG